MSNPGPTPLGLYPGLANFFQNAEQAVTAPAPAAPPSAAQAVATLEADVYQPIDTRLDTLIAAINAQNTMLAEQNALLMSTLDALAGTTIGQSLPSSSIG